MSVMGLRKIRKNASWEKNRLIVLKRDKYCCVNCGVKGKGLHVHHLVPRSAGGTDEPSNLRTLCSGCHALPHMNLQVSLSRKVIESWALRLARWLDVTSQIPKSAFSFRPVLGLLGKQSFRSGQLEAVLAALRGESILYISPTGSGKSLCFQVPTLLRSGFSLIIAPLRALMRDQVRALHERAIPASYVNSDISKEEKELRYRMLENKYLKFFYCTPERFGEKISSEELERLKKLKPTQLVIDEAHVVPKWGRGFRPDYSKLALIRKTVGNPPVLAFTATAGLKTQKVILEALGGTPDARVFVRDVDRPNVSLLKVEEPSFKKRISVVSNLIKNQRGKKMIFVPTIKIGEKIVQGLKDVGTDVPFYHGKLKPKVRESIENRFIGLHYHEVNAVICTSAFGMGLDVPDVRVVVHWQHPFSIEDYVQEFGRAGRDGKLSIALLFTSDDDCSLHEYMIEKTLEQAKLSNTEKEAERKYQIERLEEMSKYAKQNGGCLRKTIKFYFEEPGKKSKRPLSVKILNFVFSSRRKVEEQSICCSNCDPAAVDKYLPSVEVQQSHKGKNFVNFGKQLRFKVGDEVFHDKFGKGRVVAVEGEGTVTVFFQVEGEKVLLSNYVPMKKIS